MPPQKRSSRRNSNANTPATSLHQNAITNDNAETAQPDPVQHSSSHYSIHGLNGEVDLSKYNSGLKLIPQFNGSNWEEFKRKLETQFTFMGIETYLAHPPSDELRHEVRNDKLASAQILMRLPQVQYKQVSQCETASAIWKRLKTVYDETAESKAANLFLQFIHLKKKSTESMKLYLEKLVTLYHDLNTYDINISTNTINPKMTLM